MFSKEKNERYSNMKQERKIKTQVFLPVVYSILF